MLEPQKSSSGGGITEVPGDTGEKILGEWFSSSHILSTLTMALLLAGDYREGGHIMMRLMHTSRRFSNGLEAENPELEQQCREKKNATAVVEQRVNAPKAAESFEKLHGSSSAENLKQLQQENTALKNSTLAVLLEIKTDSSLTLSRGWRNDRNTPSREAACGWIRRVKATPLILGFTMATEPVVSEELEQLWARIQTLEDDKLKPAQAELSSLSPTTAVDREDSPSRSGVKEGEEGDAESGEKEGERYEDLGGDAEEKRSVRRQHEEREKAARAIQTNWREHRNRDIVMLQSALRGHLLRESKLKDLLKDTQNKAEATSRSDVASSEGGEMDVVALTMMQSAFRGHLARCSLSTESSGFSVPSLVGNSLPMLVPRRPRSTTSRTDAASVHNEEKKQGDEDPWPVSSTHASRLTPTTDRTELHCTAESGGAAAIDSDDSDDIIVSPSRPLRSREVLIL
ncbi:IQ domain-containing protein E [Lates japonicus]|uniref:IQ domain-containing protein E n=1 Tax=Lates japonicus TaxID=270547 RepID=A0AAD3NBQ9_LATJO|nr:IQ domain-containing protein E [Lates japonicus]